MAETASLEGQVAGLCLILARAMSTLDLQTAKKHKAHPSLNIVAFVCERFYRSMYTTKRGRPPKGETRPPANDAQKVKLIWRKFRHVAPLWAALMQQDDIPGVTPRSIRFLSHVDRKAFAAGSVGYEGVRTEFLADRAKRHTDGAVDIFFDELRSAVLPEPLLPPEHAHWVAVLNDAVPDYYVPK